MENNALLISAYTIRNGQVYRNYYVVYNGVYTLVKIDVTIDFIKDNAKRCPCYDYNDLSKVIKKEKQLENINVISYSDYKVKYGVK